MRYEMKHYICEKCGKRADTESFEALSNDERWLHSAQLSSLNDEATFAIVHRRCAVVDGQAESLAIHKVHRSLALIEIAWKVEDEMQDG